MTKTDIYRKKATQIIKESIKSVVYIDEKAWNPFEDVVFDENIKEHNISKMLYKYLKTQGINVNIHKFTKGEQDLPLSNSIKEYLFRDIDLVLLDWDLDVDDSQNEYSLKFLDDVIRQPHIHFCSIYSSSPDFDDIIQKVIAYFYGYSISDTENIRQCFDYNDDIVDLLGKIDISSKSPESRLIGEINKLDSEVLKNVKDLLNVSYKDALIPMAISANIDLAKPERALSYPIEIISNTDSEFALIINNTLISILKKEKNKPKYLINNFAKLISSDRNKSFFKLLGLDMQNQFSKYGAFINPEILNISFNTFMHHRKMIDKSGDKPSFEDFIKNLFIENSKLHLTNIKLQILDNDFLNKFRVVKKKLSNEELSLVNSFYNGARLKQTEGKNVNFGDVFFNSSDNNYYLCITPLCDCVIRNGLHNTNFKYYFVKGSKISNKEGISKGDGGFISYIEDSICISWSAGEYIKPFQFFIPNPIFHNNSINIFDWYNNMPFCEPLEYRFSLKNSYTQRIANQAFAHPLRVGVDFVKI